MGEFAQRLWADPWGAAAIGYWLGYMVATVQKAVQQKGPG